MKKLVILFVMMLMGLSLGSAVYAEDEVTRDEVMTMCEEAATMVMQDKAAAIAEIGNKKGQFVWKDTYVFLMDMDGNMLAHPMIPQLTKKGSLLHVTDKNSENPKLIFIEFVEIAKNSGTGWLWYMWPKPNDRTPTKKFTYIKRVGSTDMFVGAGLYK